MFLGFLILLAVMMVDVGQMVPQQKAHSGQFPFMASIRLRRGHHLCDGCIISKQLVIATAECIWMQLIDVRSSIMPHVIVGSNLLKVNKVKRRIKSINIHPQFNISITPYEFNVALLQVSEEFHWCGRIKPITVLLPNMVYKLDESSKNCKYCGWGTSGSLTKKQSKINVGGLKYGDVTIKNISECEELCKKFGVTQISERHTVCATISANMGFYSDAGTPLFCSNKLIGLYMVGPVCRHSKQNVHVFVNVGSYNRWISEVTNLIDSASLYSFNMLLLFLIPLLHLYI